MISRVKKITSSFPIKYSNTLQYYMFCDQPRVTYSPNIVDLNIRNNSPDIANDFLEVFR